MKKVTFYLGPVGSITARQLTITRQPRAGDDTMPSAQHDADAGANETVSVDLPDNTIWEAKLVDSLASGETSEPQQVFFHTGELSFPGKHSSTPGSLLRVMHMEDLSSSSSSSSASSESSSSSQS